MDNPWKIVSFVFIILFILSVLLGMAGAYNLPAGSLVFGRSEGSVAVGQAAVSFIRDNLIGADENVTLLDVTEESGVYRISTGFTSGDGQQTIEAYVSKDGKYLFPASYRLDDPGLNRRGEDTAAPARAAGPATCADIPGEEAPEMEAFVVSYCPYGTQMQGTLADIVSRIPALAAHIRVRYMGEIADGAVQSMHGATEAAENLRQICIREEQPDAYWKYVSCFISTSSPDSCAMTSGVDTAKLDGCTGNASRGLRYAQTDFTRSAGYGVQGSPTLVLNGVTVSEFDFGGRNPEAIKTMLCCGFTTQPDVCTTTLSSDATGMQGNC